MVYKKPTYEEYCKATQYAKVRYRFGVYIQLIAAILLLLLLIYTINNVEEMKANPADYAEKKMGITCNQPFKIEKYYIQNGSFGNISNPRKG